jgi:hypothetical protein
LTTDKDKKDEALEDLLMSAYPVRLLEADNELLARIRSGCDQDHQWVVTKNDLQQNTLLKDKAKVLPFHMKNSLIYFDD